MINYGYSNILFIKINEKQSLLVGTSPSPLDSTISKCSKNQKVINEVKLINPKYILVEISGITLFLSVSSEIL